MANTFGLIIIYILVFGFLTVSAQESQEISQLEKYYHDKCLKNSGSVDAFNKLRTDVYEMYQYLKYSFQFLPNQRKIFCKSERPNLEVRIKEIEKDLKPCLRNEEKFMAEFVKESFHEFLHFFCHNEGEYTTKLFGNEMHSCREKLEASKSQDLEYCLNRIFPPITGFMTKKDMCDDLTVARKCVAQVLEQECRLSYGAKDLNQVFFSFLEKPCNGCGYLTSGISVLFFSIIIHLLCKHYIH